MRWPGVYYYFHMPTAKWCVAELLGYKFPSLTRQSCTTKNDASLEAGKKYRKSLSRPQQAYCLGHNTTSCARLSLKTSFLLLFQSQSRRVTSWFWFFYYLSFLAQFVLNKAVTKSEGPKKFLAGVIFYSWQLRKRHHFQCN